MILGSLLVFQLGLAYGQGHCITVRGDQIRLKDLAPILPEAATSQGETPVMFAPRPGVQRQISAQELTRSLGRLGIEATIPQSVCIERAALHLSKEMIIEAMRRSLSSPDLAIEVVDFSRYAVPDGALEFPRSTLPTAMNGRFVWRGRLRTERNQTTPIWAAVRIVASHPAVVAITPLQPGAPVRSDQIEVREMPGWRGSEETPNLADYLGRRPKRRLNPGTELVPAWFQESLEVEQGDIVEVHVERGAITLKTEGVSEGRARKGDWVWVSLDRKGQAQKVRAQVAGAKTVKLEVRDEANIRNRADNRSSLGADSGAGTEEGARN